MNCLNVSLALLRNRTKIANSFLCFLSKTFKPEPVRPIGVTATNYYSMPMKCEMQFAVLIDCRLIRLIYDSMMKQHVELDWTFGLAWKIIMFILIVCTCGIGPQAVFTYPDRSGSVVWAAYCAFCATWPHLRGFNCSINGTNSRALSVDQLKSGRRRVTVWTGRQWS
ncbi:hypothetical protein T01_13402 [Trichinella spiralis]|uniref:Uncharacterized protein n=1 Tax=Trichinella spiralis TaxID=6334 RepID=A0A0V1BGR7_TRISP|nr:hypothetical protein T01_13402 [Trichinella spiralis]